MTSLQALTQVKRKLGLNKVGHLGTLDPAACGVLVLLCGRATKLTNQLHAGGKVYRTLIVWQKETDTLDDDGVVIARSDVCPTVEQINAILPNLVGDVTITIPRYSAVHINGQRAYDLARQGVDFTLPQKVVRVDRFALLPTDQCLTDLAAIGENYQLPDHANYFEIVCEAGTYIRSLAKLLAEKLGTVATASVILRTRTEAFDIKDAVPLNLVRLSDLQPLKEF